MLPSTGAIPKKRKLAEMEEIYVPSEQYIRRITAPDVLTTDCDFLRTFEQNSKFALQYKDPDLIIQALKLIPIKTLEYQAIELLRGTQREIKKSNVSYHDSCLNDVFLVELLSWFKNKFFKWINSIPCKVCGKEDVGFKSTRIISENGTKVEILYCCNTQTKFYRYNDVEILMKTRQGRCGEFANCFTFFCCALGYEARLVYAYFDHAWTEIYSVSEKRWVHVDPSEMTIDTPLMYQIGWKRKIDYVVAYSYDDVQDVTWRYTNIHRETRKLRIACTEKELIDAIQAIRKSRQQNLSEARKKYLVIRDAVELLLLTIERPPTVNEMKGRMSGSLTWRQTRGEMSNYYEFKLRDDEIIKKQFNIQYNCASDTYERFFEDQYGNQTQLLLKEERWQTWHFSSKNIFRKVENDWNVVYLAREEGTDYAEICWKFDFSESPLIVKKYRLEFVKETFHDGNIQVNLINDQNKSNDIIGSNQFTLKATLKGGNGNNAWQHTQLFRQRKASKNFPFIFNVRFEDV